MNTKPRRILIETPHGLEPARIIRRMPYMGAPPDGYVPVRFDVGGALLCHINLIREITAECA